MTAATANPSKPSDVPGFVDRIVRPLTHRLNPHILRIAGSRWVPFFSLLTHRGHKSGHIYRTPLTSMPKGGWFWLALTFGDKAGWVRNIVAAGEVDLRYKGVDYHLVEPVILEAATVRSQLPLVMRYAMPVIGVHKVIRMRPVPKT